MVAGCRERTPSVDMRPVELVAKDGVRIAGQLYTPDRTSPPGIILVHRLGSRGESWAPFARRARQAGYLALAVDLRGHGASTAGPNTTLDYRRFGEADWRAALQDLEAARDALLAAGADPDNLFIAGEALGASLALQYAIAQDDIQGAILVSPGLDYKGFDLADLVIQFEERPTLLISSEGDALAATTVATLERVAAGHLEVHAYGGAAHGTDIFTLNPHAAGQSLVWLDQMLATTPSPP